MHLAPVVLVLKSHLQEGSWVYPSLTVLKTEVSVEMDIVALTPELQTVCSGKISGEIPGGNCDKASVTVLSSPYIYHAQIEIYTKYILLPP